MVNKSMSYFKVALLQLFPAKTQEQNLVKGLEACKKGKGLGADLALFPELWSIGYDSNLMTSENILGLESDFIQAFIAQAKKLEMAIAITYLGRGVGGKPTNKVAVIDHQGRVVLDYAKVNICSFEGGTEIGFEAGGDFKVEILEYVGGRVSLGAMICFDREFPESARALATAGAEIILVPNACDIVLDKTLGDVRLAQLRGRAFENMVGIAMTNYPAAKHDGHSCAINVDGSYLLIGKEDEEVLISCFDLTFIRQWRNKEPWGNRYGKKIITTIAEEH